MSVSEQLGIKEKFKLIVICGAEFKPNFFQPYVQKYKNNLQLEVLLDKD